MPRTHKRNIVDIIKTIIVQNIMENNSQKEGLR